jgi:hypothetical protein
MGKNKIMESSIILPVNNISETGSMASKRDLVK